MIITTSDLVAGRDIVEALGAVRGNVVRARFVGTDFLAGLRMLAGGEGNEYTKLMAEAREQAVDRMIRDAQLVNADAIVAMRLTTSMIMQGAAEILAYGTAVRLA